jgi:hypothetical protein
LPPGKKTWPPKGFTGENGRDPTPGEISKWCESKPDANVCLRVPDDVIGIDVDAYGGKTGDLTLKTAVQKYGELPDTWTSTARGDGPSRIHFYRVSPGVRFVGELEGDNVEIIQRKHRYAVVWPSVHPEGGTYQWYRPDGAAAGVPEVRQLAKLPQTWIDGLRSDRPVRDSLTDEEVSAFTAALPDADGTPCEHMQQSLAYAIEQLESGESRHKVATDQCLSLLQQGMDGHRGVETALVELGQAFVAAVNGDKAHPDPESEYRRAVLGAPAALKHPDVRGTPCECGKEQQPLFRSLASITPIKVEWLWRPRIPYGKITIIEGDPDLGKSLITLDLAGRLSTGRPLPLESTGGRAANVLLV